MFGTKEQLKISAKLEQQYLHIAKSILSGILCIPVGILCIPVALFLSRVLSLLYASIAFVSLKSSLVLPETSQQIKWMQSLNFKYSQLTFDQQKQSDLLQHSDTSTGSVIILPSFEILSILTFLFSFPMACFKTFQVLSDFIYFLHFSWHNNHVQDLEEIRSLCFSIV